MSISLSSSATSPVHRFVTHLRNPLYRNGYALVLSSAATSALGMVYWILAARSYTDEAVGLNSALISTMIFLASVAQLNLVNALNRFIPRAGRATGRLAIYAYLISLAMALTTGVLFVLGIDIWAPALGFLGSRPFFTLWFTFAIMTWCIFVLQDSLLTGLRRATWVPIENTIFALAKIVLLIGFARPFPQYGVFASWTVPVVALLLPVNLLIFRRLIPRHVQATQGRAEPIVPVEIAKYVVSDYFGSLIWMATINLLPLIVLERVGAAANAYFYLSWTIAYSLYLVSRNMGMSLITEAAMDQTQLRVYSYRMFVQTARLLVPGVTVILLGAPYILRLFGNSYATEGTALLRLLCLSALPNIVTSIYVAIARVQRRMIAIVLVFTSLCALVLTLSYILLEVYGIMGVGVAWLSSQTLIATILMFTQLRSVWSPYLDVRLLQRPLTILHRLWWYWSHRRHVDRACELVPYVLPVITPPAGTPPPVDWSVQSLVRTAGDVMVFTLGPDGQPRTAVLKLPQTSSAVRSLQRQRTTLAALHADPRLGEWRTLMPTVLAAGEVDGQPYTVEQMLSGLEARAVLFNPEARMQMQSASAAAIEELHRRTAVSVVVDAGVLSRWIDEPLLTIRRISARHPYAPSNEGAIDQLMAELHSALAGRTLSVSWVHGDFSPRNILVTPDGATLTGIVDWDLAAPDNLPQLDLLQLLLSTRMSVQSCELGDVVQGLLDGDEWTAHESALLDAAQSALPGDAVGMRALLLLCWLRHVAANLTKSTRYAGHWLWWAKNVEGVLCSL